MNGALTEITRTLQSNFEVDQKDGRTRKEAIKQPIKKEEIFTITRPEDRDRYQLKGDAIPPGGALNINFSPPDPRDCPTGTQQIQP